MKTGILTSLALISLGSIASAATYIDFGSPAGSTTTVGSTNWNTITTVGPNSLVNTSGDGSGLLELAFSGSSAGFGGAFNSDDTGSTAPGFLLDGGSAIDSAIGDGLYLNRGSASIEFYFTDLEVSTSYLFTVYGGRNDDNFSNPALIQSVDGTTQLGSYNNRQSATFNVLSDGLGVATFRLVEDEDTDLVTSNVTLVGLSFAAVPEPGSAALLGLGGLALLGRRRR